MSEHTRRHGKRQVQTERASLGEYWARYRAWVHGMSRGEKIRYRALQTAVFLSILIIVGYLILSAWIKLPDTSDLPGQTTGGQTQGDPSDLSYDGGHERPKRGSVYLPGSWLRPGEQFHRHNAAGDL